MQEISSSFLKDGLIRSPHGCLGSAITAKCPGVTSNRDDGLLQVRNDDDTIAVSYNYVDLHNFANHTHLQMGRSK